MAEDSKASNVNIMAEDKKANAIIIAITSIIVLVSIGYTFYETVLLGNFSIVVNDEEEINE